MNKQTQWQKIIDYCKRNGSITVRDAVGIGVNSLTKRISEMVTDPRYTVTKADIPVYDEDGKRVSHYVRYWAREGAAASE